eukprot:scaffold1594_cov171-Ochromonas_danica.AAC.10
MVSAKRKTSNTSQPISSTTKSNDAKSLSRAVEREAAGAQYGWIIGLDEAGRGPLAGPVVAAACCFLPTTTLSPGSSTTTTSTTMEDEQQEEEEENNTTIPGIADSKLLNEEEREDLYHKLIHHPNVKYAVSIVSHEEIDEINILQASLQGMKRACEDVIQQLLAMSIPSPPTDQIMALVDGNKLPTGLSVASKAIIQGDRKIYSIAAASIIAKVTRDHLMISLHEKYPQYNFMKHKGYPTPEHRGLLMELGPCEIHRRSYAPVQRALEAQEKKNEKKDKIIEQAETPSEGNGKRKRKSRSSEETKIATTTSSGKEEEENEDGGASSKTVKKRQNRSSSKEIVPSEMTTEVSSGRKAGKVRDNVDSQISAIEEVRVRRSPRLANKESSS